MWTVVRAANLVPVPWRNGQGVTRDVLTRLAPDGSLEWQVSIADLVGETGFSDFTGYDRVFTPIADGVELAFGDGAFVPCPLLVPMPFAGEQPVRCRVAAPARAFNAIARRPRPIAVDVLRLVTGEAVPAPGGTVVLHCWKGSLQVEGQDSTLSLPQRGEGAPEGGGWGASASLAGGRPAQHEPPQGPAPSPHPALRATLPALGEGGDTAPTASTVLHGGDSAHGNGHARALSDAVVLRVVTS